MTQLFWIGAGAIAFGFVVSFAARIVCVLSYRWLQQELRKGEQ